MKKTALCLALALALPLAMAGCSKAPEVQGISSDEQIAVLAEAFEGLENEIDWLSYDPGAQYAVTDLDGDGFFELVVSSMQGTGLFTYSRYYEVNADGSGVTEWTQSGSEGDSQPDIGYPEVAVYADADGIRHYLFEDYIRNGYAENWMGRYDVVYRDNTVERTLLAQQRALLREGTEEFDVTFYDENGKEITEAEFDAIPDTVFEGMTKQTAHIGWMAYDEAKGLSREDLTQLLTAAWEGFSVE